MKILQILSEARRNADHPSQYENRSDPRLILEKYRKMTPEDRKDLYVSFTEIDKLGVNPKSSYSTPIGIYTYPLEYISQFRTTADLPFAGTNPYMWVVKPTVEVLELTQYSNLQEDRRKAYLYLTNILNVDEQLAENIIKYAFLSAKSGEEASKMWNLARIIGLYEANPSYMREVFSDTSLATDMPIQTSGSKNDSVYFNKILRKVFGYRVISDNGSGTIHGNEPTQAVFLDLRALKVVDKLNQNTDAIPHGRDISKLIDDPDTFVVSFAPSFKDFSYTKMLTPEGTRPTNLSDVVMVYSHYTDKPFKATIERIIQSYGVDMPDSAKLKNLKKLPRLIPNLKEQIKQKLLNSEREIASGFRFSYYTDDDDSYLQNIVPKKSISFWGLGAFAWAFYGDDIIMQAAKKLYDLPPERKRTLNY